MIEKLKAIISKWEDVANTAWSDPYSDAMWNCINDIQELIDKEIDGAYGRRDEKNEQKSMDHIR